MRAEHITASPDLGFVSSDKSKRGSAPEVVLSVEVVEKAGGGHAGGERLVPHPRCTSSDRVALAMQAGSRWWASTYRPNKQSSRSCNAGLHGLSIQSSPIPFFQILSAFATEAA